MTNTAPEPVSATSLMAKEIAEHLSRMGVAKKRLYSLPEACEYLGIGATSLRRLVSQGELKDVSILPGHLRFDVKDLDRLIDGLKR